MISRGPSRRTGRRFNGSSVFWIADVILTGDIILALPASRQFQGTPYQRGALA